MPQQVSVAATPAATTEKISIDDFAKIELRVGLVKVADLGLVKQKGGTEENSGATLMLT